ncbi:hypothetical protein MKX03_014220 [Papaver bracteatum]|nr:hypothetical protein MKX03_014220 [Papaver bracteatum]
MIISMDLNASSLPKDDKDDKYEEEIFAAQVEEEISHEEHMETAVETMHREREERRQRLKRDFPDEGPKQPRKEPAINNTRFYDKNKLPLGWMDCPAAGDCIGYIIPSKVPLGETFNECIFPGKRYSLKQVIHQQKVLRREVGLVIDLTNTTRYYYWKKQGIKHVKIACKGKDSVPDPESVNTFVYEVSKFCSRRQKQSNKYILVHCTHGHNRTGFMIVHFLMRSKPLSVTDAIRAFQYVRPPGIYKQDYIDSLYSFYHETNPEHVSCPNTPEWKRSSDLDLNGEAMPDDEDDGGTVTASQDNQVPTEVLTNDDVLGDAIPWDQQEAMRLFCYHCLKLGAGANQFPGSHPVSLNRENLQLLRQRYYYATWKADGTRYMMLITSDGCFLIDRNFNFRRVQMRFSVKPTNGRDTHNLTLLDGEMVIDTLPDTLKTERRYLIYDLMAIDSVSIMERPFCERWKMLEKEVIEPRKLERRYIDQSRNPYYRYDLEPFRVRRKDFWLLPTVTKLLKGFIPKQLSHEADGIIFQGWDDPYVPRTHEGLLKWKYPEMNSVDFLFEVVDENRQLLYLYERGKKKLMDGNHVDIKNGEDPSDLSGKIIECSWDSEEQVWNFMRVRVDKSTPNDINTYRKVMRRIKDNITEEILLEDIGEIVRLPMYADRIRNETEAHSKQHSGRRR